MTVSKTPNMHLTYFMYHTHQIKASFLTLKLAELDEGAKFCNINSNEGISFPCFICVGQNEPFRRQDFGNKEHVVIKILGYAIGMKKLDFSSTWATYFQLFNLTLHGLYPTSRRGGTHFPSHIQSKVVAIHEDSS